MAWNLERKIEVKGVPNIGICIPHTGKVDMHFVEKCYGPLRFQPLSWCNKVPFLSMGPPVDTARNALVEQALDAGMDYIFFIDSDMIPYQPPDANLALYALYALQAPIVTGLYRAKKRYGFYWAVWKKVIEKGKGYQPLINFDRNIFKADIAGLGCTLIHRDVFDNIKKPWFKWDSMRTFSEDFYFFRKAQKAGYDLLVRGDVRFHHLGTFMISGGDEPEVILPSNI